LSVGRYLRRANRVLGHVAEGPVAEDRRIEGGVVVVGWRHDAAKVALQQVGVLADGLGDGAEDDALGHERLAVGGGDGGGVDDGDVGEALLLGERDAEAGPGRPRRGC
jgi:hypothetical protein